MAALKWSLPVVVGGMVAIAVVVVLVVLLLTLHAERETVQQLARDNQKLTRDNNTLTKERDAARHILRNQERTLQVFDQISKAGINDKQRNQVDNDAVRAEIRPVLAAEPAARVAVPAAVTERVRDAVSAVRAGPAGSAPR